MKPRNSYLNSALLWLQLAAGFAITIAATPAESTVINQAPSINSTEQLTQIAERPSASTESVTPTTPSGTPGTSQSIQSDTQADITQADITQTETQPNSVASPPSVVVSPQPSTTIDALTVNILSPTANAILDVPAATVVLQFAEGSQIELRVNGEQVNSNLVGRTETNSTTHVVTQTWYGISLKEGENILTAHVISSNGTPGSVTTVKLQVRGTPKQLSLSTVEARIPADGRSIATIKGQLLDKQGNRSGQDAVVTLAASTGELTGKDFDPDRPGFQVEAKQGQFTATLKSGLEARTVRIRAAAENLEAFTQLEFEPNLRPSIATGVIDIRLGARGTDFYRSFRDFLPPDNDNHLQLDVRSAAFATGRVGNWLFTTAFNSDRPLNQTCDNTTRLFRDTQFCEQNYPVYGDSSTSQVLTPSQDHFYARIERTSPVPGAGIDYFMWGDYNTEEFARRSQQFTATTRQLHGFKANFNVGNLQITGLYGNNVQGFQRDTIAPDGTSGYYFVSRRLLVPGSENVFIELEELTRPGTVINRKQLTRGTDYEIDYDRGTLLFRQPILRTDISADGQILVRRIVTTYQFENRDSKTNIYAGRLQYNFSRGLNESWLGATYVRENQGVRKFELYGADVLIALGSKGHLIAEYAHSKNTSDTLGEVSGSAYRLEVEGEIAKGILGQAYWRETDAGFANNATTSFVPGQRRYGANLTAALSPATKLRFQYDHEDNYGVAPQPLNSFEDLFRPGFEATPGSKVDNSLTTISAGVQQQIGSANLQVDWLHRQRTDRLAPNLLDTTSNQLRSRFSLPLSSKLTFFAQNELTLSSETDAVYPDRTLLGLNWEVKPGMNLRLAQQFYTRGQFAGKSITSLDMISDYKLGPDTTLTSRYSVVGGANGLTSQSAIGLNHRWTISPGLHMDLSYERISGDLLGTTGAGLQFAQPYAVGQSAASLGVQNGESYSAALEYTGSPDFKASARYEHRSSSTGSNTVISASAIGKISPSLTALVRYQQANFANQKITGLGDTVDLKLGLAYRNPNDDKFNALLRYEYRKNPSTIPDTLLFGSGTGSRDHVFALEAIYAPNWRWEFYGKYALRHSTTYLAKDFSASSTVSLAQLRATYRLGYRWDMTGEVRWISQSSANYHEMGAVIEAGYYLTPNLRLAAGYAFGNASDRDFDGSRSAGGPYIGLTIKLNELWGGFGQQRIPRPEKPPVQPVADAPSTSQAALPSQAVAPVSEPTPAGSTTSSDVSSTQVPVINFVNTQAIPNTVSTTAADLQF